MKRSQGETPAPLLADALMLICAPELCSATEKFVQLFTTKRQKGWAVSVVETMQISVGKLALRFLPASLSQLECELVA
jgi:hypothetical protein